MNMEFPKIVNRLAFFDFDRTLVSHQYSQEYMKNRDSYYMECVYALSRMEEEHANDRPLPCMQWYVRMLMAKGYGLYCLTHEMFNLHDELKQEQLKRFYPDTPMTYLTVDSPEHKIDLIMAVTHVERCCISDVIFVDDRMQTVSLALEYGIQAKHLSDIAVLYETDRKAYEEADAKIRPDTGKAFMEAGFDEAYREWARIVEEAGRDHLALQFSPEHV